MFSWCERKEQGIKDGKAARRVGPMFHSQECDCRFAKELFCAHLNATP